MIDITQIDKNDSNVWSMIGEGRVKGCFQIESHLGKTWCQQVKPENIDELAALISIIRPGCLKSISDGKSMTQHYVDRKHGHEEVSILHESITDILDETYGIIVFQEQAMKIAEKMASFDLKEADNLRKAIGKKNASLMKEMREKFIEGCLNNNISKDKSEEVFDIIEKSNRYSFNKSHAVAYALMCYWSAFLKYYYPEKFFKHWLRNADEKIDPDVEKKQLIMAARSENIEVKGPHLTKLYENFSWEDNAIYFGICNVKNVGKIHLDKIKKYMLQFDQTPTWSEFVFKVLPHVNKRAVENLIKVGAFSGYSISRTEMLHHFSCIKTLTTKELQHLDNLIEQEEKLTQMSPVEILSYFHSLGVKKDGGLISSIARSEKVKDIITRIQNPGRSLSDNPSIYAKLEEQLLGCSINHSELNACSDASYANTTIKEINDGKTDKSTIAGIITNIREHKTKNKDMMAFLSCEDFTGELENIVIFPDVYEQNKDIIYRDATLLLTGEIKDKKRNSFIIESVFLI